MKREDYSSFWKLLRVTALVHKFLHLLKSRLKIPQTPTDPYKPARGHHILDQISQIPLRDDQ